jgi:hypothetical protein
MPDLSLIWLPDPEPVSEEPAGRGDLDRGGVVSAAGRSKGKILNALVIGQRLRGGCPRPDPMNREPAAANAATLPRGSGALGVPADTDDAAELPEAAGQVGDVVDVRCGRCMQVQTVEGVSW